MGVASGCGEQEVGVASGSGCGCKEVYRFPHTTYPYCSFAAASLLFVHFVKCFSFLFQYFFAITFNTKIMFSRSINTHTGNYGCPTAAI